MKRPASVFVYGTLRPGRLRWPLLEPWAEGHRPAAAVGALFDTGLGYPGALFAGVGHIPGDVVRLRRADLDEALAVLDDIEDVDGGLYRRLVVALLDGHEAWSYEWARPLDGCRPIDEWP